MATFDELWNSVPAATSPDTTSTFDRMWAEADSGPRTWGDTFSDLGKSFTKGASGVNQMLSPMLGIPAQAIAAKQMEVGDPELKGAGLIERSLARGVEMTPYAALGGGVIPAFASGVAGEIGEEFGLPEWLGQLLGGSGAGLIGSAARSAPRNAAALENRALGFSKADVGMSARQDGVKAFERIVGDDGKITRIPVKVRAGLEEALQTTKADGLLKRGLTPQAAFQTAAIKKDELGEGIGKLIGRADSALAEQKRKIFPAFDNAQEYIDNFASKNDVDDLQALLDEFKTNIQTKGNGTLGLLQNEKVIIGSKAYPKGKEYVKPLDDMIYADLASTIKRGITETTGETTALEGLNKLFGSYEEISNRLRDAAVKGNIPDPSGFFSNLFKTTGGGVGGGILGTLLAGPVGGAIGFGVSVGAKAAQTPTGKSVQSKLLKALGGANAKLPSALGASPSLSAIPALGSQAQKSSSPELLANNRTQQSESLSAAQSAARLGGVQSSTTSTQSRGRKKLVPSSPDFISDPDLSKSLTRSRASAYKNSSFIDRAMDRAEGIAMDDVKATAPYVINVRSVRQETDLKDIIEKGLIPQESGGNPNAVSEKGAVGLGQLMPKTGEELAKKAGVKYNPKDPEQNKMLSTMYLQELLQEFDGDLELALTSYHSGPNRVKKLLAKNKATTLKEIKHDLGPIGQKYAAQILERLRKSKVIYV
jgi:hypothetical protein